MAAERFTARLRLAPPRPGQVLASRVALLVLMLVGIVALFWAERDGLRDQIDGTVTFADVLYFTAVTVATVGYGDIVPVSDSARLVNTVVVTPLRLVMWLVFLGTAYEFVWQQWMEQWRMSVLQRNLRNHLVICGYGLGGESAAAEALAKGEDPRHIIVLDPDERRIARAVEAGFIGMLGDARQARSMADCAVERARAVLVCVGRDDTAVLAVLTIRQISADVRIICKVEERENAPLVRQAGASETITPSMFGGYLMANSIDAPHVVDYVNDLISADGRVELIERPATATDIGRTLREISPGVAVRIHRGDQMIGFWEGDLSRVRTGDILLEIRRAGDGNA